MTLNAVSRIMFGQDLHLDGPGFGNALDRIIKSTLQNPHDHSINPNLERDFELVEETAQAVIDQSKCSAPCSSDTILDAIIEREQQTGPRKQEVVNLLVAGHESASLVVTWTILQLAKRPALQAAAADRATSANSGESARRALLPFINESMRLVPPVYAISRTATQSVAIHGVEFSADTTFVISPWLLHRDPRNFTEPLSYQPERWENGLRPQRGTFLPFSLGPRVCVGEKFARQIITSVLHTTLRTYEFHLPPNFEFDYAPLLTVRAGNHIPLECTPRRP